MKKQSVLIFVISLFIFFGSFPSIHSLFAETNPSIIVITSASMKPTINVGDLVFVVKADPKDIIASQENGDIIVIKGPQYFLDKGYPKEFLNLPNNTPIVHRAIEKYLDPESNEWYFVTKGDANQFIDGGWDKLNSSSNGNYYLLEYNSSSVIAVPQSQILGKIYCTIPVIGYCAMYSLPIFCILIALSVFFSILEFRGLKISIKVKKRGEP